MPFPTLGHAPATNRPIRIIRKPPLPISICRKKLLLLVPPFHAAPNFLNLWYSWTGDDHLGNFVEVSFNCRPMVKLSATQHQCIMDHRGFHLVANVYWYAAARIMSLFFTVSEGTWMLSSNVRTNLQLPWTGPVSTKCDYWTHTIPSAPYAHGAQADVWE